MKKQKNVQFLIIGILIVIVIAMAVSLIASSFPDGLEKVAENLGFIDKATETVSENFFLIPDYVFSGVSNEYLQTSLAGLFGVMAIFIIFGIVYLIYKSGGRKE